MNPQIILSAIAKAKTTRYGLMFLSGLLTGGWLYEQYPDVFKAFYADPRLSLVAAVAGLWLSSLKTKDWEAKVETASQTPPTEKTNG